MANRILSAALRYTTKSVRYSRLLSLSLASHTVFGSHHPDLQLEQTSLPNFLIPKLDRYKNKVALVDAESGRSYTFNQLKTCVVKIASAIRKLGYVKGDVIAIHATNSPEYAILLLALPAAGITITTSNSAFTPVELVRNLEIAKPSCIFASSDLLPVVKEALKSSEKFDKNVKEVITFEEVQGFKCITSLMEDDGSAYSEDLQTDLENDIVVLPFSSGTTGLPKAVMLNHRCMVANLQQMQYALNLTEEDSFLGLLPLYHAYGMIVITYTAFLGGQKLVTVPRFEPGMFLKTIEDHKISYLHLVPPMTLFLAKHPMVGDFDLSCVRRALCGAAPLGEALQREYMSKLGSPLVQGFGMTEFGPGDVIDIDPPTFGTCGYLVPNTQCKIVHQETKEILSAPNISGEICLKGPQMMKGYLNNQQATNDAIRDGWLHTGDVGYVTENGQVVITDRLKDLIKYKAFQIAPAELEDTLLKHPNIQDATVIGVPDSKGGEVPKAFVVRKPNSVVPDTEIFKLVKAHLSDYKQLRGGIQFVDEIPKSPSGKILRRLLKEQYIK